MTQIKTEKQMQHIQAEHKQQLMVDACIETLEKHNLLDESAGRFAQKLRDAGLLVCPEVDLTTATFPTNRELLQGPVK